MTQREVPISSEAGSAKFLVFGDGDQVLQAILSPADSIMGNERSFIYRGKGIKQVTVNSGNGPLAILRRAVRGSGGGVGNIVRWTNDGASAAYIGLSAPLSGKIVPIDLRHTGVMLVKTNLLLCSMSCNQMTAKELQLATDISPASHVPMQRVSGSGMCFIQSVPDDLVLTGGAAVEKVLQRDESILVEMGCVAAYSDSCKLVVEQRGPLHPVAYPQGFNVKISGPGTIIIQSTFVSRLNGAAVADRLANRPTGVMFDATRIFGFTLSMLIVWLVISDL